MAERGQIDAQHPWPWLDPFTEGASNFFNGRDEDAQALQRSVLATPVCVLFGKSGLGKTSLLLAGLLPLLPRRQVLPVPLRRIEHGPGAPPLSAQMLRALDEALARSALRPATALTAAAGSADPVAALWERLHDRRQQLLDHQGRRWTVLFLFDQFEEIFTLQGDELLRQQTFRELGDLLENRVPPQVAARLDTHDELLDHLDLDSQPARFLVSLREDFLPELEPWTGMIPRLGPNRYRLMPMATEQAMAAVQMTGGALVDARAARRIVEFLGRQGAQAGLAMAMTGVTQPLRQSRRIEPALLSLVCASLNADRLARQPPAAQLDVAQLETRGAQILDRFYDDALACLPAAQRSQTARWVEANLITDDGTRRPYPLDAVDRDFRPALRELVNQRLLRVQNTEQGDQIELVHDRLAAVALNRARAEQQQADAAAMLQRQKDSAELELFKQRARATELAEERAELERARAEEAVAASRLARRLLAGLATMMVAAIGVSLWAMSERSRAVAEAEKAMIATEQATIATEQAQRQASRSVKSAAALASVRDAADKALEAAKLLGGDRPDRSVQAKELLSAADRTYKSAVQAVQAASAPADCPTGRRVYPQVASKAQQARLDAILPALHAEGFIVPRAEIVDEEKMPNSTEMRYFRRSEEGWALAATAILAKAGLPGVPARYVRGYEDASAVRPCHYELWLVAATGKS